MISVVLWFYERFLEMCLSMSKKKQSLSAVCTKPRKKLVSLASLLLCCLLFLAWEGCFRREKLLLAALIPTGSVVKRRQSSRQVLLNAPQMRTEMKKSVVFCQLWVLQHRRTTNFCNKSLHLFQMRCMDEMHLSHLRLKPGESQAALSFAFLG